MAIEPRFRSIPDIPLEGVDFALFEVMVAVKQNLELLTGTRGEEDNASRAVVAAKISVPQVGAQRVPRITADGSGFTLQGARVPSYDDYVKALTDMQNITNDVTEIRAILNTLITQLKG